MTKHSCEDYGLAKCGSRCASTKNFCNIKTREHNFLLYFSTLKLTFFILTSGGSTLYQAWIESVNLN